MSRRWFRALLGLYPRRWRRRYGAELERLVAELEADHDQSRAKLALGLIANAGVERIRALGARPAAALIVVAALGMTAAILGMLPSPRFQGRSVVSLPAGQSTITCRLILKPGAKGGASAVINPDTGRIISSVNSICAPSRNSRASRGA